ncbi:hypothetical protein KP509_33G002000 [Ceratopteris richardii]|uniref:Uncharacterized protein n=1 Tax=Ceratopteris richardii TaxID=49495 RepID=A0A8T2QMS0_CERRI|nr:hypothetical protein KP509_33G001900 [Ceratopteris richardii]KAH7284904.1 hypothetical protein KP509_33G002000 [Ceratopteris richardii]
MNVVTQLLRFPSEDEFVHSSPSIAAQDLIRGLLVKDPSKRLAAIRGAAEIKQHPFFAALPDYDDPENCFLAVSPASDYNEPEYQSSIAAKEFLYLLYSTVFITTLAPIKFAVIPVICQSLLNVTQFLKRDFRNTYIYRKYLDNLCKWVDANQSTVSMLSANCEIGVGFLLVFLLLSPRKNFVQVLAYWQLLKLMYHAPATAYFHRSIWSHIGTRVNPLIYRYVPFLQTPLQFAQRWFQG